MTGLTKSRGPDSKEKERAIRQSKELESDADFLKSHDLLPGRPFVLRARGALYNNAAVRAFAAGDSKNGCRLLLRSADSLEDYGDKMLRKAESNTGSKRRKALIGAFVGFELAMTACATVAFEDRRSGRQDRTVALLRKADKVLRSIGTNRPFLRVLHPVFAFRMSKFSKTIKTLRENKIIAQSQGTCLDKTVS
jgi:hypothetical protein